MEDYALDGQSPYDWRNGKLCCLVCRRQFPDENALQVHLSKSDLHRNNIARLRNEGRIIKSSGGAGPESGAKTNALDALLGGASKLEKQLQDLKQKKAEAAHANPTAQKQNSPTGGGPPAAATAGSSLDALFAFETKMRSGGSGGGSTYRDRAKERRELAGSDDTVPHASVKRAREINNNIDWKCFHCLTTNFARVIVCTKCGKEVDAKTEYLHNHMQEKRHKAIMKMAMATNGLGKIEGGEAAAIADGLSGLGGGGASGRPGLGSQQRDY